MSTVSETVDTLITTFAGQVFEPGDDLAVWFTHAQRGREYRRFRGSMSERELAAALARLLPDGTSHAKKILAMNRPPASLREVMEDTAGRPRTLASLKKELVEGRVALEKAAKKFGIRGQVWWAAKGDRKCSRSREVNAVQEEEQSPAIQAILKGMEAMQVTVAALAAAQAGGGTVAAVEAGKPKEDTEIDRLRAENEQLRATQADGSWEQRYRPKGKGGKGGKGKGPAQGCFTCGGPHYQSQCPQWQGKGHWGGRGGGYSGGYGNGYGQGGGAYNGKGGYNGYGGGQNWGQYGDSRASSSSSSSSISLRPRRRPAKMIRTGPSCP